VLIFLLRVITGTTLALEKAIDERAKESQKHNEYMMLAATHALQHHEGKEEHSGCCIMGRVWDHTLDNDLPGSKLGARDIVLDATFVHAAFDLEETLVTPLG